MNDPKREPGRRPTVLRCDRCGAVVVIAVDGEAWCLPCGRKMKPVPPSKERRS